MKQILIAALIAFTLLICAIALRVLVPYYSGQPDRKHGLIARDETRILVNAFNSFLDANRRTEIPATIQQLRPYMGVVHGLRITNVDNAASNFWYLPPRLDQCDKDVIIVVEKPNHYKEHGGVIGTTFGSVRFVIGSDYDQVVRTNNLK